MSSPDLDIPPDTSSDGLDSTSSNEPRLDMTVEVSDIAPCRKRIKISIPRSDIEEQFVESLSTMRNDYPVRGFRPGKAPLQLVERHYRKEAGQQVKGQLLMRSLKQLEETHSLNALSQPNFDVESVILPDKGPMVFDIELEVPPEFDLPDYQGLAFERPVAEVNDAMVDAKIASLLYEAGQTVPKYSGDLAIDDLAVVNLTFNFPNSEPIVKENLELRVAQDVRFRDATIEGFGPAVVGGNRDQVREATCRLGDQVEPSEKRGAVGTVKIQILDLKTRRGPAVDSQDFLKTFFVDSVGELRDVIQAELGNEILNRQRESLRNQVFNHIIPLVQLDMPHDLMTRQTQEIYSKKISKLEESGHSIDQITAFEDELRVEAQQEASRSIYEMFLLSRIGGEEQIDVDDEECEAEIVQIAIANREPVRRVRARIEKENLGNTLSTQVIQRKTIERIVERGVARDVPLDLFPAETLPISILS